jgi:hypothetical protein
MTVAMIRSMVRPGSGVKHIRKHKSWTDEVWEMYERFTGQPRPDFFQGKTDCTGRPKQMVNGETKPPEPVAD